MEKAKQIIKTIFLITATSVLLVSCGGGGGADYGSGSYYESGTTNVEATPEAAYPSGEAGEETLALGQELGASNLLADRKIIKTFYFNLESKTFDDSKDILLAIVKELGGYIESSEVSQPGIIAPYSSGFYRESEGGMALAAEPYYSGSYVSNKYARYTFRIPADKSDAFSERVAEAGIITNQSLSSTDASLTYTDTEARIASLEIQEARLLEFMTQTTDVESLLLVEKQLSEIIYEKETLQRQNTFIDSQVDYCTVNVTLSEVLEYTPTPVDDQTLGDRMSEGIERNINYIKRALGDFSVWFVVNLVFLVPILIIAFFAIFFIRKQTKKRKSSLPIYTSMAAPPMEAPAAINSDVPKT